MNTLLPTTIGLELPGASSATRHLTFSVFDQVSGTLFSYAWPVPSGPRHCSQSPAVAVQFKMSPRTNAPSDVRSRKVGMRSFQVNQARLQPNLYAPPLSWPD